MPKLTNIIKPVADSGNPKYVISNGEYTAWVKGERHTQIKTFLLNTESGESWVYVYKKNEKYSGWVWEKVETAEIDLTGSGSGSGSGYGDGSGTGYGHDEDYSLGSGYGSKNGFGEGEGYGDGKGCKDGSGYGNGSAI